MIHNRSLSSQPQHIFGGINYYSKDSNIQIVYQFCKIIAKFMYVSFKDKYKIR